MSENIDMDSVIDFNQHLNDINKKEIPIGSIVYFLENSKVYAGKKEINFGILEEHYANSIGIHLIEPRDTRCIDGIPIKEFTTPTRWQKLPKGWTYDTQLFAVESDQILPSSLAISDREQILQLYKEGKLVNVEDNDHAYFESEIDRRYGWRIVRRYRMTEYHPCYISVNFRNVFTSYEEARAELDRIHTEFKRQSELSEYDWSVELIDSELDRWAELYHITDIEKQKCRDWLLSQNNVENIEVRIAYSGIQWKYLENKKWMNIVV